VSSRETSHRQAAQPQRPAEEHAKIMRRFGPFLFNLASCDVLVRPQSTVEYTSVATNLIHDGCSSDVELTGLQLCSAIRM